MQQVIDYLKEWNKQSGERVKLQQAYAVATLALVVLAGLVGLLNSALSDMLLRLTFASAALFIVNAVAWALLDSFLLQRLKTKRK